MKILFAFAMVFALAAVSLAAPSAALKLILTGVEATVDTEVMEATAEATVVDMVAMEAVMEDTEVDMAMKEAGGVKEHDAGTAETDTMAL